MAEELTPTEPIAPVVPDQSNADVKSNPLFQKVAGELSSLREQIATETAAKEAADKEAEMKRAQESGDFEKALSLKTAEIEKMKVDYESEMIKSSLTNALLKAKVENSTFIAGAIAGYDGETPIAEYVSSLADSEDNKPFFGTAETHRQTQPAPSGSYQQGGKTNWETIRAMEKSSDPKQRAEAADHILEYSIRTGELPPE